MDRVQETLRKFRAVEEGESRDVVLEALAQFIRYLDGVPRLIGDGYLARLFALALLRRGKEIENGKFMLEIEYTRAVEEQTPGEAERIGQ